MVTKMVLLNHDIISESILIEPLISYQSSQLLSPSNQSLSDPQHSHQQNEFSWSNGLSVCKLVANIITDCDFFHHRSY